MDGVPFPVVQHGLAVVLTVLLLVYLDRLSASPVIAVFSRWVRWLTASFGVTYLLHLLELSSRPYWVLATCAFLLWFLLETFYNWVAIAAYSKSSLPLFPSFEKNETGDEWPAQRSFIGLREWLRREEFTRIAAIRAEVLESMVLRQSIYQSKDGMVRVQVMFLPHRSGKVAACYNISSQTRDEQRLITDNQFLPYGGFFPESWSVERKPWTRSIEVLLKRHEKRMRESDMEFVRWEDDPLIDLNDQQRILERINTDLGFLFPRHMQEEFGKITTQGRYRVWKEIWLLSYFGLSNIG